MDPIEHYKPFIEAIQQHVVLVYCSNGKLAISSYKVAKKSIEGVVDELQLLDHVSIDNHKYPELIVNADKKISNWKPIDLLILHNDYPQQNSAISNFDHFSLLSIGYKYCDNKGVILCNAGNIRGPQYLSRKEKVSRLFKQNIFIHLSKIKKSGLKVLSEHSIVATNGYPDKIVSLSFDLRQLYYQRTQSRRTLLGRLLVTSLVYSGLTHMFEPGYLFKLQK